MTPELIVLVLAALWQVVQFALAGRAATRDAGRDWAAGPRDTAPSFSPLTGRLQRAVHNHGESLLLYAIAALITTTTEQSGTLATICAVVYLAARILYLPAYAQGWTPGRSIVWTFGFLATMIMLIATLF